LEALGICVIDAGGDTNIPAMAALYKGLGKRVFAVCDKQTLANQKLIEAQVEMAFVHEEKGIEDLVLKNTPEIALARFCTQIKWPEHLLGKFPQPFATPAAALREYFKGTKAEWGVADYLAQCDEHEIPEWFRSIAFCLNLLCDIPAPSLSKTTTSGSDGAVPGAAVYEAD
jgi:putative ATP-dependent endonuclease of OLD family